MLMFDQAEYVYSKKLLTIRQSKQPGALLEDLDLSTVSGLTFYQYEAGPKQWDLHMWTIFNETSFCINSVL